VITMSRTIGARRGRRRFTPVALAAIAACCLAAGCTAAPWPAPSAGPVTVTILSGTDTSSPLAEQHESGMYSDLVNWWNQYEKPQTGITIALDTVSGGATAAHSEMLADAESENGAYDIYNLDNEWVPEFAAGHFIWSLQNQLPDPGGFLRQPLESGTYGNQLYAAPFTSDVGPLYYRTDLLTKPQVKELTAPTFDFRDLIQLAGSVMPHQPQLTIGYDGQFADYEGLTVNLLEIANGEVSGMFAANGTIADPGGLTTALAQLSGSMTEQTTGVLPETELNYEEGDSEAAFANGTALFMRNWPIYYEQIKSGTVGKGTSQVAGNFSVVPLPFPSVLGGQDLAIAKASPHPAAALKVIEYLTSPAAEQCLFQVGGFPATRGSAYPAAPLPAGYGSVKHPLCGAQADPEVAIGPQIKQAINKALLRPRTRYYTEFSSIIQNEVSAYLADPVIHISDFVNGLTKALNAAATTGQSPPS
jgi:multiple sugar transport system substrate-binding protein